MKTLKLYEVGVDPLPVDGMNILYFDSSSSYGMFEYNYTKEGTVNYCIPEDGDKETVLLEEGGFDDYGEPTQTVILVGDDQTQLVRGVLWMYTYEYYPTIGSISMPFQEWKEYKIAEGLDILTITEEDVENYSDREGVQLEYLYHNVNFNNEDFKITWVKTGKHPPKFLSYTTCSEET